MFTWTRSWMNEQMRKQLKTWKICTDRYNSNGLVQIYSDIFISSKNTIVLIQSTHVIWRDQRLACEVRRFGLVTPRFVILSLAGGGRVVAVKQSSTSGRCCWLQILLSSPNINSTQCLSCNWRTRLFWKLAPPSARSLPAKYCAKYWATVFDGWLTSEIYNMECYASRDPKLPSIGFLTARLVQTQWNGLVRIENTFAQVGGKYVWFGALAASWTHVAR